MTQIKNLVQQSDFTIEPIQEVNEKCQCQFSEFMKKNGSKIAFSIKLREIFKKWEFKSHFRLYGDN